MSEIIFSSDTKHRKEWFTGLSFSHPAKMVLPLQLWLIDRYTKEGETILDPMAGSGTILVACSMGRNVVTIELEDKFVQMQKGNWEKMRQRGCQMGYSIGTATILQGDARNLEGLMADKIITSPPYEASITGKPGIDWTKCDGGKRDRTKEASLPSIIASLSGYDAILTSPPYEGSLTSGSQHGNTGIAADNPKLADTGRYASENKENIGNLKSESYLQSMLTVYQNCFRVLKSQGLMILVTKNFIRNKAIVRLDTDTIKLCEQAGFTFKERHFRKLTAQSFWRTIYHQKFPDVEPITHEDILVFERG